MAGTGKKIAEIDAILRDIEGMVLSGERGTQRPTMSARRGSETILELLSGLTCHPELCRRAQPTS